MIKLIVVLAVLYFGGRWLVSSVTGMFDQALAGVAALLTIAWLPGLAALAFAAWRFQVLRSAAALLGDKQARIAAGAGLAAIAASLFVPDSAPPKALAPGVEKGAGLARARGVPGPIVDKAAEKVQELVERRQADKAAAAAAAGIEYQQPTSRRAILKDALKRSPDPDLKPGQFPGDQYRELGIEPNSPLASRLSQERSWYGQPLDRSRASDGRPEGSVPAHVVPRMQRPWFPPAGAHPDTGGAAPELPKAGTAWKSIGSAESMSPASSTAQGPQSSPSTAPFKIRARAVPATDPFNSIPKPQE